MQPVKRGDPIKASVINGLITDANKTITGSGGLVVRQTRGGTHISMPRPQAYWLGIIDTTGHSAFSDNRYWIVSAQITNASTDPEELLTVAPYVEGENANYRRIVAHNTAEHVAQTHDLDAGVIVTVFEEYDASTPAIKRYWFIGGGELPVGQYQGMVLQNVTQNEIGFDFVMAHAIP